MLDSIVLLLSTLITCKMCVIDLDILYHTCSIVVCAHKNGVFQVEAQQDKLCGENHLEDCHLVAFSIHFAVKSACVFVQLFFFEPRWHLASGDVFVCRSIWASGDNILDGQSGSNGKHGKQVYFNSLGKMKRRLDGVGHLLSINQLPLIIKG